ncbi:hypothetical protein T492DRAFT_834871 [Pavlovales sp. CCMP2436]|nr:hypothetical protein T492DRAFT_834871 [Pavlovales sp. CCMP2436]
MFIVIIIKQNKPAPPAEWIKEVIRASVALELELASGTALRGHSASRNLSALPSPLGGRGGASGGVAKDGGGGGGSGGDGMSESGSESGSGSDESDSPRMCRPSVRSPTVRSGARGPPDSRGSPGGPGVRVKSPGVRNGFLSPGGFPDLARSPGASPGATGNPGVSPEVRERRARRYSWEDRSDSRTLRTPGHPDTGRSHSPGERSLVKRGSPRESGSPGESGSPLKSPVIRGSPADAVRSPRASLSSSRTHAVTAATPVSATPVSAAPVSATPVSATPVSAAPVSAAPVSATPVSATPVSAAPVSATPVSTAGAARGSFRSGPTARE